MSAALCLSLIHLNYARLRIILAIILVAVVVWYFLPDSVKAKVNKVGHAIGNFQARVLLTVIYAVLIMPFGLMVRFFSDSLHSKKRPEQWFDHPPMPNDLNEARRQG